MPDSPAVALLLGREKVARTHDARVCAVKARGAETVKCKPRAVREANAPHALKRPIVALHAEQIPVGVVSVV